MAMDPKRREAFVAAFHQMVARKKVDNMGLDRFRDWDPAVLSDKDMERLSRSKNTVGFTTNDPAEPAEMAKFNAMEISWRRWREATNEIEKQVSWADTREVETLLASVNV